MNDQSTKATLLGYPQSEYALTTHLDSSQIRQYNNEQKEQQRDLPPEGEPPEGSDGIRTITLSPGTKLMGTGFGTQHARNLVRLMSIYSRNEMPREVLDCADKLALFLPNVSLSIQDVIRWRMAWRALLSHRLEFPDETDLTYLIHPTIVWRCEDWPNTDTIWASTPVIMGFAVATLIYGGLHALAWLAHFESPTQQLLWRMSACVVMGGIPMHRVLVALGEKFKYEVLKNFTIMLIILVFLAYLSARAYLVVECFINVSHLPADVYRIPNWSAYFPHVS